MIPRNELVKSLNFAGLAEHFTAVKKELLRNILNAIPTVEEQGTPQEEMQGMAMCKFLMNNMGPAQASSAMEQTIAYFKERNLYTSISWNGDFVHNTHLIENAAKNKTLTNDEMEGNNNFTSVLRQFLLPRYAYLDFDRIIDPRHLIDLECGYPKFITPIMYRYMYDRDDVARRVVDIYPDECAGAEPVIYEDENEEIHTPFEEDIEDLCERHHLMQYIYRIDRLSGIGHYGAMLVGLDDGEDLEKPVEGLLPDGSADPNYNGPERNILYLRPFDEYLSFIHMYETDVMHPRYGLPKFYNLVFLDMTIDAAGASIGTRLNRRVHWSRVIHVPSDNLGSSLVFATPRMQCVFNRLLDLRKVKGSSAEMFWKGAFQGLAFEIDPQFVADDPTFDKEEFREEIRKYSDGMSRYLSLIGIKAHSLAPTIPVDPDKYVELQLKAISCSLNMPHRVFMGSEEGRVASSQDKLTWNIRLKRRAKMHLFPYVIRNIVDRFIALRVIRPPKNGKYFVEMEDLNTPTDEDKANLALKWSQAISQYVATGMIHLIQPKEYFTLVCGFSVRDTLKIIETAEKAGGFSKLLKVDPSQGAGVNGKRQDIAPNDSDKRDSGEAKSSGMKG